MAAQRAAHHRSPPNLRTRYARGSLGHVITLVFSWDLNPHQRLLYGEMEKLGAQMTYLGRLKPSHTLNVILVPFELVVWRLRSARVVHLNWVFGLAPAAADQSPGLRAIAWLWFLPWLWTIRPMCMRLTENRRP